MIPEVVKENKKNEQSLAVPKNNIDDQSEVKIGDQFHFKDELLGDENENIGNDEINNLLKEFDSLSCQGNYNKVHQTKNYLVKDKQFEKPIYCSSKIKNAIFNKLPSLGYSPTQFNRWIIHHIYEPLAYRVDYNYSYISILS